MVQDGSGGETRQVEGFAGRARAQARRVNGDCCTQSVVT